MVGMVRDKCLINLWQIVHFSNAIKKLCYVTLKTIIHKGTTISYALNHMRMPNPWFMTPLPLGAHPECIYQVWNEITFKHKQMAYILNPSTYNDLNCDPRELYAKLVTLLSTNITILQNSTVTILK